MCNTPKPTHGQKDKGVVVTDERIRDALGEGSQFRNIDLPDASSVCWLAKSYIPMDQCAEVRSCLSSDITTCVQETPGGPAGARAKVDAFSGGPRTEIQ
eukprot:10479679-Karenia_brevis.AAC.1